jgi:YD repeat-containing protein
LPEKILEEYSDFQSSRETLKQLGILGLPGRTQERALSKGESPCQGMANSNSASVLGEKSFLYYPKNGQLAEQRNLIKSSHTKALLPSSISSLGGVDFNDRTYTLHYDYDRFGNRIGVSDSLGKIETVIYDALESLFPVEQQNAQGHTTMMFYEGGFVPSAAVSAFTLPSSNLLAGQLQSTLTPQGVWSAYDYDNLGRRTRILSSNGSEQLYSYRPGLNFKPSLIKTKIRRYLDSESVPEGESRFVEKLLQLTIKWKRDRFYENAEKGGGRVMFTLSIIVIKRGFKYIPYATSSVSDVFDQEIFLLLKKKTTCYTYT